MAGGGLEDVPLCIKCMIFRLIVVFWPFHLFIFVGLAKVKLEQRFAQTLRTSPGNRKPNLW